MIDSFDYQLVVVVVVVVAADVFLVKTCTPIMSKTSTANDEYGQWDRTQTDRRLDRSLVGTGLDVKTLPVPKERRKKENNISLGSYFGGIEKTAEGIEQS